MTAQRLGSPNSQADLSTSHAEYFGRDLVEYDNLAGYPFRPDDGPLMRHSFVYQRVFSVGSDEYGGIQLRARIHTYGDISDRLRDTLERVAYRAAYLFDSSVEESRYGANQYADGYLSGFDSWAVYRNFEDERIASQEQDTPVGVIDWSTEIYLDDSFDRADLSGIAQGLANPYGEEHHRQPGREPIHIPPHRWRVESYDSRPDYYELRPPANTDARDRYREGAGRGKTVYVNGKRVATTDNKGRAWLKKAYASGDTFTRQGVTKWSREGLVHQTDATWQALRDGGVLYLTGETRDGIYLATAAAKPGGWKAGDPDTVPVDLEADEGAPERDVYLLTLADPDDAIHVEGRRDDQLIKHMGYSSPPYSHQLGPGERWP